MDFEALWLTLRLAVGTTAILLVVALPLAWWIASGRGAARALVQAVVALPLVLPPTVLGFYLLVALGPLTCAGTAADAGAGPSAGVQFCRAAGGVGDLQPAVCGAAAGGGICGGGSGRTSRRRRGWELRRGGRFGRVVLPMTRGSLLTSAVLTFTHTVGEFGVVLMLGGNIPGATQTLSISLYDQVQEFNYAAANRTALVLVAVSLAALLVIYSRRGRLRRGELV